MRATKEARRQHYEILDVEVFEVPGFSGQGAPAPQREQSSPARQIEQHGLDARLWRRTPGPRVGVASSRAEPIPAAISSTVVLTAIRATLRRVWDNTAVRNAADSRSCKSIRKRPGWSGTTTAKPSSPHPKAPSTRHRAGTVATAAIGEYEALRLRLIMMRHASVCMPRR